MEIVGSVPADQVPAIARRTRAGLWTGLADRAIAAHQQGEVLIVSVADTAEYRQMRGGMLERLSSAGYVLRAAQVDQEGSIRVYLQLEERQKSVVVQSLRRPRKRANG